MVSHLLMVRCHPRWTYYVVFYNSLYSFQHFYQRFGWKHKACLSSLCVRQSCGVIVSVLNDRTAVKRIAKSWKDGPKLTEWYLTGLAISSIFGLKKKIKTQLYEYRMVNTWLNSSRRWTSFRVLINCKLNYETILWCGSEKRSCELSYKYAFCPDEGG